MKKQLLVLVGILASLQLAMAKDWSLEEAIQVALEKNPNILEVQEKLKDADSKVSEAWGSALPSLSLQAKYNKAYEQYSPKVSENLFANSAPFMNPNSENFSQPTAALAQDLGGVLGSLQAKEYTTNATFVLTQVLFAQGKIGTGLEIAESYEKALLAEKANIHSTVKKEVTTKFLSSLYLQKVVEVLEQSLEQAHKHFDNVKNMEAAGLVAEIDRLSAEIKVEELKSQLEKMKKNHKLAMNALLHELGETYDENVNLVGELSENPEVPELGNAYQVALQNRSELNQLENAIDLQESLVDIAKADYLPSVVAGATFSKVSNTNEWNEFDWGNDGSVFVQAQWNLFNGFQTKEKVVQARTEVRRVNIKKDQLIRGLKLQIESELKNLKTVEAQVKIDQHRVSLAEKNYSLAEKSYQAGNVSQLTMQDAELNLRRARLDSMANLLELNKAVISLKYAMGIL